MMSRKDYQAFAELLGDVKAEYSDTTFGKSQVAQEVLAKVGYEMARLFKRDNPAFDAGRFYAAVEKRLEAK